MTRSRSSTGSRLRAFSGILAGGLVVLAASLVAAWLVAAQVGVPGPGLGFVAWHWCAAGAAVGLQLRADRGRPRRAVVDRDVGSTVAALGVLVIGALVPAALWFA